LDAGSPAMLNPSPESTSRLSISSLDSHMQACSRTSVHAREHEQTGAEESLSPAIIIPKMASSTLVFSIEHGKKLSFP